MTLQCEHYRTLENCVSQNKNAVRGIQRSNVIYTKPRLAQRKTIFPLLSFIGFQEL